MNGDRLRKTGVLVLAGALFLAATPAATAAPERVAGDTEISLSFFDALTAWVSLWLDAGPGAAAVAFWQGAGTEDRSGQPGQGGSENSANDDPTASPQLGGEADPDG